MNVILEAFIRVKVILKQENNNYDACWKFGRIVSFIGEFYPEKGWGKMYEEALPYIKKSIELEPDKAEGYLWNGVLIGRDGQEKGIMKSLKNLKSMKESLLKSIELDDSIEGGLAYRVLGRLYFTLPKIVGGNFKTSLDYLLKAKALADNPITNYYLADTFNALDERDKSIELMGKLLDLPSDGKWVVETKIYKEKAEKRLEELSEVKATI